MLAGNSGLYIRTQALGVPPPNPQLQNPNMIYNPVQRRWRDTTLSLATQQLFDAAVQISQCYSSCSNPWRTRRYDEPSSEDELDQLCQTG